jgi:hypothetical protein
LEAPNSKHQISNKSQITNSKQAQRGAKSQKSRFGHWIFEFGAYLKFGIWDLEFIFS